MTHQPAPPTVAITRPAREDAVAGLRAEIDRLNTAQQLAGLGSWEWDADTGSMHCSAGLQTLLGRLPSAAPGAKAYLSMLSFVSEEDRARVEQTIEQTLADQGRRGIEHRVRHADGQELTVRLEIGVRYRRDGTPAGLTATLQDVSERVAADHQVQRLAYFDHVTGLPNRSLLYDRVRQAILRAKRYQRALALLFLDLDHFKKVNDTLGHEAGDQLLRLVSERLTSCVRDSDSISRLATKNIRQAKAWDGGNTVSRLGGDEFVVLLTEIREPEDALRVARRINVSLTTAFEIGDSAVYVPTSIGISSYPADGDDAENLLQKADTAMYHAKSRGRGRFQLYTPALNARVRERKSLQGELREALERGEFVFHYQPRANIERDALIGVEALLRWRHPQQGLIGPDRFIGIAEQTGSIVALGEWVLFAACAEAADWQRRGHPLTVSVNLSALQFNHQSLPATVAEALRRAELGPSLLELELTERVLLDNPSGAARQLRELRALGVKLVIDNFGTGYSSLNYLRQLPIDGLKIDRSFVAGLDRDTDERSIVAPMVALGHSLGLTVTAEGVETEPQLQRLRAIGCDQYQGYLLSEPLGLNALHQLLENGDAS